MLEKTKVLLNNIYRLQIAIEDNNAQESANIVQTFRHSDHHKNRKGNNSVLHKDGIPASNKNALQGGSQQKSYKLQIIF